MRQFSQHAAAACLATLATAACASPIEVSIYDRTAGRALEIHEHRGERWVSGEPGHEYEIRLENRAGRRLLAVTSVDGVNVVTGETATPSQNGYVIDPWSSATIDGWRKSLAEVAAFYFTALPDSYAARTGRPDDVGVIGIAIFRERPQPVPVSAWRSNEPAAPGARAGAPERADAAAAKAQSVAPVAEASARLGTGHGERYESRVEQVAFERASEQPDSVIRIYYDSPRNLLARGVIRPDHAWAWRSPRPRRPDPFPAASGFVPDP
jgi:hypothetical protein